MPSASEKRGRRKAMGKRALKIGATVAVIILLVTGLYGLWSVVDPLIAIAAAVVLAGLTVFRFVPRKGAVVNGLRLLPAIYVSFLALVGFDVIVNFVFESRIPIWLGLMLAVAIFALVAYWYLTRWSPPERKASLLPPSWRAVAAVLLAAGFVLLVPFVVGLLRAEDSDDVPTATNPVPSKLDIRIVGDGLSLPAPPELPPTPVLEEFSVSYSVGYAAGDRVRWTLVDSDDQAQALKAVAAGGRMAPVAAEPVARPGADSVLLLLVDGTSPVVDEPAELPDLPAQEGEVARWRHLVHDTGRGETATFALLQTVDQDRIRAWRNFVPDGEAVSEQALASRTVTDAAARLEVGAPSSEAYFALALAYEPILLFDSGEGVPWPISVSSLFTDEDVRLCNDEGQVVTECELISRPGQLESGGTHLQLTLPDSETLQRRAADELRRQAQEAEEPPAVGALPPGTPPPGTVTEPAGAGAPVGAGSAIYVHPFDRNQMLYLDYWWYLPDNPVALGGGALCGAGLVIADVTCPSHESDWEGMTVVVDQGRPVPQVVAVRYAQHASVVSYRWGLLHRRWVRNARVAALTAGIAGATSRPLAFIARGTHATYPYPCTGDCEQVASSGLREEPHDGALAWIGDRTAACGNSSCLQLLPTHNRGTEPALWNAYGGTWGDHHCLLTYYCDSATPPTAPGNQRRYKSPTEYDGAVGPGGGFRAVPGEG